MQYELLWWITFGAFLSALLLGACHAIIELARRSAGEEGALPWLVWFRRGVNAVIVVAFGTLTAAIVALWIKAGYPPFSNLSESLLWMAWAFCGVYFVMRLFVRLPGIETGAAVGALIILALSGLLEKDPRPLMPALQSKWLVFHVLTCMMSYGAFFAAFCMSILWLLVWRKHESGKTIDALSYHTMAFGFLLLTIGIMSGSVWAHQAWGRYWGWDNKETWSLITWIVYGIYLHFRLISGKFGIRREKLPALNATFALVGFAFTMFTYLGVSYLLPSLHSYLSD